MCPGHVHIHRAGGAIRRDLVLDAPRVDDGAHHAPWRERVELPEENHVRRVHVDSELQAPGIANVPDADVDVALVNRQAFLKSAI